MAGDQNKLIERLNNTVWVTLKSSGHGIGVFAIRDIPKGKAFCAPDNLEYRLRTKHFDGILPEIQKLILDRYIFESHHDYLIFNSPNDNQVINCFVNHSDKPNTDGRTTLRKILKDEEITQNYIFMENRNIKLHKLSKEHYKTFLTT